MAERDTPPPGSDEALRLGCRCAVLDNAHGRGYARDDDGRPLYWITEGCPVHASLGQIGERMTPGVGEGDSGR